MIIPGLLQSLLLIHCTIVSRALGNKKQETTSKDGSRYHVVP
jgi:hypothetical protein